MSKQEMRFLRREIIATYLRKGYELDVILYWVRFHERFHYGFELKAYK